jgi:hypothetical protein
MSLSFRTQGTSFQSDGLTIPPLDKYLLSFLKGTRQRVGINLAYAEIYLVLASVFRAQIIYIYIYSRSILLLN